MAVTEVVEVVERGRGRGREREDKVWPLALPKKKDLILTIDACVCVADAMKRLAMSFHHREG